MLQEILKLYAFFICLHTIDSHSGSLEKYGPFEIILYSKLLKCNHDKNLHLDVSDIGMHFYDFPNQIEVAFPLRTAAYDILNLKDVSLKHSWIIFVPGFNSPMSGTTNNIIKEAMKSLDNTYYLVVDHYVYTAADDNYRKNYEKSVKYAYDISKAIAKFLEQLSRGGVPLNSIRCIGHSLGSQILGYAGFIFKESTGSSLRRITALDPAGPCFSNSFVEDQVRTGAADYVEIFHCNAGGYGTDSILGDVDFFFNNKGEWQPHCHVPLLPGIHDSSRAAKCSHEECIEIYASTVFHRDWFVARQCDTYKTFKEDLCNGETVAGFWSHGSARGVYYVSTKGKNVSDY